MPLPHDWPLWVASHLWQGTVFGLLCAALMVFFPGPARLRHFAGCLALLRFFLPAALGASLMSGLSWTWGTSLLSASGVRALWLPAFIVGDKTTGTTILPSVSGVWTLLLLLWALGALALLSHKVVALRQALRKIKREAKPFPEEQQARLRRLEAKLGLKPGCVRGEVVGETGWLGVTGIFRSRILVPEGLFLTLDDTELDSVLLHELAHVRRRDNLLRLLQAGAVCLLWFHPLVWWLDKRLLWESEKACDETVLRLTGSSRSYAEGLAKTMRYALGLGLPGVSGMSRIGLSARLHDILNHKKRKDSPVKNVLLSSALLGLLGLSTLLASPADPTAPQAPAENVFNLADLDQRPVAIKQSGPLYPAECRKAHVNGEVVVRFIVNREGKVVDATSLRATDPRFIPSALDAVKQWLFQPGVKNQKPVNTVLQVPIVYSITEG